ncbi:hypothetical protein K438DRAFT_1933354 [Mycena galopus ATCC 62051]|nr:hypothetical protein K438DRAFT_1933354 [Mycena galopus ATCC 62051]
MSCKGSMQGKKAYWAEVMEWNFYAIVGAARGLLTSEATFQVVQGIAGPRSDPAPSSWWFLRLQMNGGARKRSNNGVHRYLSGDNGAFKRTGAAAVKLRRYNMTEHPKRDTNVPGNQMVRWGGRQQQPRPLESRGVLIRNDGTNVKKFMDLAAHQAQGDRRTLGSNEHCGVIQKRLISGTMRILPTKEARDKSLAGSKTRIGIGTRSNRVHEGDKDEAGVADGIQGKVYDERALGFHGRAVTEACNSRGEARRVHKIAVVVWVYQRFTGDANTTMEFVCESGIVHAAPDSCALRLQSLTIEMEARRGVSAPSACSRGAPIAMLMPHTIEEYEILKDAESASNQGILEGNEVVSIDPPLGSSKTTPNTSNSSAK